MDRDDKTRQGAGARKLFREVAAKVSHPLGRKYAPDRLKKMIACAAETPILTDICKRCGISTTSLKYYRAKSMKGKVGDGFDIPVDDERGTIRFHEAFEQAMHDGMDRVEKTAYELGAGTFRKVLTHQGRVIYKVDPDLVALGFTGHETYLRDEFGDPIPETVREVDPDMARYLLKAHRPELYGDRTQVDVLHRGGVLVVGIQAKTSAELTKRAAEAVANPHLVEFRPDDVEDGQ